MITRREFIRVFGGGCTLALGGLAPARSAGNTKARVVIIGGGFGGATAAKYLRLLDPGIEVTLIERNPQYVSCVLSNGVIVGERDIAQLTFGYEGLSAHGVTVVPDEATGIDPVNKTVATASGTAHSYDWLIVAPGIDFKWDTVEGYSEQVSAQMPHAYKAGEQTLLLRQQIEAMRDGGLVVIVPPPKPFRCPPGPYERASLIANYLTRHKPKSKIIILDPNSSFSKKALFEQAWAEQYGDMITWVPGGTDGIVQRVDAAAHTLYTELSEHKADVINFIPPQRAGHIAQQSGLADSTG
ncbi:MAG: NAD(P)/FAD-dependent oxidoreductase, partial [Gammaproteobacteria bacterium]|nr:NAD(P)/FAD-dependent oxidoreductase [Gammaproteobacteria bacterium]